MYKEIARVVHKLKCKKAVVIPNEVLRKEAVTLSLCTFVKLWFDVNGFPATWLRLSDQRPRQQTNRDHWAQAGRLLPWTLVT